MVRRYLADGPAGRALGDCCGTPPHFNCKWISLVRTVYPRVLEDAAELNNKCQRIAGLFASLKIFKFQKTFKSFEFGSIYEKENSAHL